MESVLFVRRQSPNWRRLSEDFRSGATIDPGRYVPDHVIPGFPDRVDLLIDQWNARFKIDFFTYRGILADLSRKSVMSVSNSRAFDYGELPIIASLASDETFYCYFHDDDDFFAPDLSSVIDVLDMQADAIVTPLFRIGTPTVTFSKCESSPSFILGDRRPHMFRYHTNNYGIHSRHCGSVEDLAELKDHILGSRFANRRDFKDRLLSKNVSATVKTPGSASELPIFRSGDDDIRQHFETFLTSLSFIDLPEDYLWISEPISKIARLVESAFRGGDYDAIDDLMPS